MAAAGFVGTLNALAPYIAAGGQIAGAVGQQRSAGRQAENTTIMNRDQAELARYNQEQLAKLAGARLTEDATQDRADRVLKSSQERARQAGIGSLLQNIQGVKIGGLPSYIPNINITGGLHPDQLGALARGSGGQLARDAVAAQLSGSDVPDLPDVSGIGLDAPEQSELVEGGTLDKILNAAGYAGAGLGAYNEIKGQQQDREARRPDAPVGTDAVASVIGSQPGARFAPAYQPSPGTTIAGGLPSERVPSTIELLAMMAQGPEAVAGKQLAQSRPPTKKTTGTRG